MKKLIILMLFVTIANAQDKVGIAVIQDLKLITVGDKSTNLKPLTPDVLIRVTLQGLQQDKGYLQIYPEFEYAKLDTWDYKRYTFNVGYIFNKLNYENFEIGVTGNFGIIDRAGLSFFTYGGGLEFNYKINDNFKLVTSSQLIKRGDLLAMYNTNEFKASFYVGAEFKIFD